MKKFLVLLFVGIILTMLVVTSLASLKRPIWNSAVEFHWNSSPWSVATLFDAYFGFLTFYVWLAYKERTAMARAGHEAHFDRRKIVFGKSSQMFDKQINPCPACCRYRNNELVFIIYRRLRSVRARLCQVYFILN